MDDWVADPAKLATITAEQDIHGEWWEIPSAELRDCILGIAYLDDAGVEFYLPAYMTMSLNNPQHARLWVLGFLDPGGEDGDGDPELEAYFRQRLSRITGAKRAVTIEFLEFLRERLSAGDAQDQYDLRRVNRMLDHEFWR